MASDSIPKLFQPFKLGNITLSHRVVMAPLTRYKATRLSHIPINPMLKTHYEQRSRIPGTLIIAEATYIAAKAGGDPSIPGIWSQEQIAAWREVTDAVHANGSYIFLQLWALGRVAEVEYLHEEDPAFDFVAPSPIPLKANKGTPPRELTRAEIQEYIELWAQAARNAVLEAGFDGVEIHGAFGYLLDQFTKEVSNGRTDEYGGNIENRSRHALEVVKVVVDAIGAERTGIRVSPWSISNDMRIENPVPQFTHLVKALKEQFPTLGYLHIVEPTSSRPDCSPNANDFIREIWKPNVLISAAMYTRDTAIRRAEERDNEVIAFGKAFIANPDLPMRLKLDLPLNVPDSKTYYTRGDQPDAEAGYNDYPFYTELVDKQHSSIASI
ncbi:hypothetical protein D9756_007780 [Leucocoprinus leucothites]|uniref:NADH:flavin oxidoreductase/NADH oxidase N-terminal domain-containing protein n=1 Tax=Leucocoprinus leucothites TaxID=201217 RepID=A0A8H5D4P7_9AGAR|nr:hypothetical protein D9756_007780 [Leucoagaricus leucothites]